VQRQCVAGTGDVLITYENEAIEAQRANQPIDYVIPAQTILIENPVAVTTSAKDPKAARAFDVRLVRIFTSRP
jgi:sulfate/thiosulfate transport system substrate-binding protein